MQKTSNEKNSFESLSDDEIVKQYMPLVRQIARRYAVLSPEHMDDLAQIGCLGLLKAIKYYESNRSYKASFKSFAAIYIKGEIRHYLRDHGSLIHVPRRLTEINSKISQLEEAYRREREHAPSLEELSIRSGYSLEEIREAMQSSEICRHYESFESLESDRGDDERALSEMVPDRKQIAELNFTEDREVLDQALTSLGDKTRQIVEFVFFHDLTQKETARILGLSEMGVSRTIKSTLAKLKQILLSEVF